MCECRMSSLTELMAFKLFGKAILVVHKQVWTFSGQFTQGVSASHHVGVRVTLPILWDI